MIDVGGVEPQRHQLKCREHERHCPDDGGAPYAHPARQPGIRYHRQQTQRKSAHVSVNQVGQKGEPHERAGERQVAAAPDGAEPEAQSYQQEMAADGLRKQSAARPGVTAVLHAVEEVSGNERRQ